jgi:hypothetical protein
MDRALPPHVRRAPRFPILMSMLYRPEGDRRWREGRTENISRSGVLFRADEAMERNAAVELLLILPREVAGDAAGTARCRGRIVRSEWGLIDPRPALAATMDDCEPLQPPDPRRI